MIYIADSGLLIALVDRLDAHHEWAREIVETLEPPFITCEAVCAEVSAVLGTPAPVLAMLKARDLRLVFSLGTDLNAIQQLTNKYRDQPMDLADACIVRMSELHPISHVITVDRTDFSIYRRFGNKEIPCLFPDH